MYDESVVLRLDNSGNVDTKKNVREDQLVYFIGKISILTRF